MRERLGSARRAAEQDVGGYDDRRLIKLELTTKVPPDDMARIAPGMEIVSQEAGTIVLAFATEASLEEFEARLAAVSDGRRATRETLLYALQTIDHWTPQDRTGWALLRHGFPEEGPFTIDVELWPLGGVDGQLALRAAFETWLREHNGELVDAVRQPYLSLYRVKVGRGVANSLLQHRDVRTVDLPPRVGLERAVLTTDVADLTVELPSDDAPTVAVLDTGVATGHPVLASAMGDAQGFPAGIGAADDHGHGTMVAGIAVYDDVGSCIGDRRFVPALRLLSGRIFDDRNEADPHLIHNQVEEAVRYFRDTYGCRVFNLSYGDLNKPYRGRHVAGLAVTLDALSRELDVLFVVPTGNFEGDESGPGDWRTEYPDYLLSEAATLVDPAPALNALTVGSLARFDRSRLGERWPHDPAYQAVARPKQPSPFTRHGPSVNSAVKPDVVDFGGNLAVDVRRGEGVAAGKQGVGEPSTSHEFAHGRPFAEEWGTSFAAPRVAHVAARLRGEHPGASPDLLRALLVAHARVPIASAELLEDDDLRSVIGYGLPDRSALLRSLESCVTLWTEDSIPDRHHHFYEIPIPEALWEKGRRNRELTVALAYRPPVRTTRIDYRAAAISFKVVLADDLEQVTAWFNAATDAGELEKIPEVTSGRGMTEQTRSRGTVQASTWTMRSPSADRRRKRWYAVVTRNDTSWGGTLTAERESYALVATIADRQASEPRLYTQIEARLRARARARVRP